MPAMAARIAASEGRFSGKSKDAAATVPSVLNSKKSIERAAADSDR